MVVILTLFTTKLLSLNIRCLSLKYKGLNHSKSEWYRPNLSEVFVRIAVESSEMISRCGPTSTEFQLYEYFDGQRAYPSWCLLVKTTYLNGNWNYKIIMKKRKKVCVWKLLGSALFKQMCPFVWIKMFGSELWCKFLIGETRFEILIHILNIWWNMFVAPIGPKPFGTMCGHRVNSPMNEDANFCIIIPFGQWSRIQTLPSRLVVCSIFCWHSIRITIF